MPCPDGWPRGDCVCPALDESPGSPEEENPAWAMAIAILDAATGHQYGSCEHTRTICTPCRCRSTCHCGKAEIVLPGPVISVSEVWIYGAELDPSTYQVEDYRYLVRLDGEWPQDVTVTYIQGFPPPGGAGAIVSELACEIAKGLCDDSTCRLPKRITSQTRQGVTIQYPQFTEGLTGLPMVDMWISMARSPKKPPHVFSPDLPVVREVTWGPGGSP
jgi:hypothetical protein